MAVTSSGSGEITPGRNIRIEGSGKKDRRGRLTVQPDGTYIIKLDDDTSNT